MASQAQDRPIIIKKVAAPAEEGHHGGAWKVAYADFVTAMMAFFLLMWLLNATTEDQRKGIADYFDPRVPVSRISGGGSSMLHGDSAFTQEQLAASATGGTRTTRTDVPPGADPVSTGPDIPVRDAETAPDPAAEAADQAALDAAKAKIEEARANGGDLAQHLRVTETPEGLRIDIVDVDGRPMFGTGSAAPTPLLRTLLEIVADVVGMTANPVKVTGHTDSLPFRGNPDYGNWELSTERAQAARRTLEANGLGAARIARVEGRADRDPILPEAPQAAENRRIGIVLLRMGGPG
ncbi:MAG: OmpA family protein [Alphaproteobacteria bacterium]|nr:OmpA family protein [Alphaproteobacteria bacterium]MDX5369951.1 OmpA family protein [Alphaproteobacteria bacterium]MDX5464526.1 OmpA family protein [Alphaproteobacteria bacterium]